ncbi:PTS transporter subunit IIC [Thomasclavelia cocleata]|uniref:PTS transporter subunit IIC n=1 Tax=Thomasclavelia cocleata TaxID=69824 RepID=UPI00243234CC|nr:PTS sugar transporter subunit IIC [Thomasclavelia cocleata]MCI9130805.1 PTS sugar transporter subunit IIC [Thomasclavelia cocleata]
MKKDNYFIKALNGMAYGFFCSLIIGTILKQLGTFVNITELVTWGEVATLLMGPAIGAGIGYAIDAKGLNLISAIIAGCIGAGTFNGNVAGVGNPIVSFVAVIVAVEVTRFVQGKTPIDILIVPFTSIVAAGLVTIFVGPYLTKLIVWLGDLINQGVNMQPLLMSIVVAVLMGMALTAPISSAAIGVMLGLNGLAAGAALAGCCAQMIGFAVMSIDDNDIGDVIAIGIGTSMLQFKNIVKKPMIWIPPIITSVAIAPISTCLLNISCSPVGSGMGTAGMVGILEAVNVMGTNYWVPLIVIDLVAPAFLTYGIYKAFKKLSFIKNGDLKLERL